MRGLLVLWVVIAAASSAARADDVVDPDSEVARRHFERGVELYDESNYQAAIVEFKVANDARPRPQLDYNIARCYDRLGDWNQARDYYKRYLAGTTSDPDNVAKRVAELDERIRRATPIVVVPPPVVTVPLPPSPRLRIAGIVVGAVAVAALGAGGGLYGSAAADFPSRQSYCASLPRDCVPSEWSDLSARVNAGYALIAVGAAAAVADVALWVIDAKRRRQSVHAGLSLGAGVRF